MSGTPISVCVIARDEEDLLRRCLDSVAWADEIVVVVDARSCDGTEKVARERTSKVEVRPYGGDIDQKRYCVDRASHDWVMIVDPDEVVSAQLSAEIQRRLAAETQPVAGYRVNRASFHLGRWIRHGDFYPDWKLRLFRKSQARWAGRDPHGRVELDGRVEPLQGELEHYSYRDLADQVDRIQFFSAESAAALYAE